MPEHEAVTLEIADGVARVRLARPATRNAIGPEVVATLAAAIASCEGSPAVRTVLISADGPSFTVGGDLRYLAANLDRLDGEFESLITPYHETLARLAALPVPVVAAVQGGAAGGGLGLVWSADVVLAADDLQLTTGFIKLGMSGDGGSSWALPRLVGLRRARQLMLRADVIGAEEALELGLVDRVLPRDDLEAEAEGEARRLADGPTVAYAHMKRLLAVSFERSWPDQLAGERAAMIDCGRTADAVEGIKSFAERRPPQFGGH